MRHLAVDFGARRMGLAVSDDTGTLASPYATRERGGTKRDVAAIVDAVRGLAAQRIVFGLPRALSGGEGAAEAKVHEFAAQVQAALRAANLPAEIEWWDERFSTREALGQMRVAGISQRRGREATGSDSVDARAAAVILQGFLDSRRQLSANSAASGGESGDVVPLEEIPSDEERDE
jgi:putative holliday junction resolvase